MNHSQAEAAAASVESGASTGSNLSAGEHVVAQASDLKPGEHKIVQIRSLEIGIYNVGGSFYALHSMCPHQFGPACLGPVTGQSVCDESTGWRFQWRRNNEILVCPWHGMQFDDSDRSEPSEQERATADFSGASCRRRDPRAGRGTECACRNLKDALRDGRSSARINTVRMGKKTIGVSSEILSHHTKRAQVQLLKQGGCKCYGLPFVS